jgi:hypothetical protein
MAIDIPEPSPGEVTLVIGNGRQWTYVTVDREELWSCRFEVLGDALQEMDDALDANRTHAEPDQNVPELSADSFIRLSKNAPEGSSLQVNADLSLQMKIVNTDGTISFYLGPAPNSMPWPEYQQFLKVMGV